MQLQNTSIDQTALATSDVLARNAPRCPACSHGEMRSIYRLDSIPVHSVLLMDSREEATNYRRAALDLGFCESCGFLANIAFDENVHEYSIRYEETQAFSDTFNAFARSLAEDLTARHDLRDKTILEIGCGKGDFLAGLCELAGAQGIGIDPAYVPQRMNDDAKQRIHFIQDFYGEKYSHLEADLICCRHTLEHIAPTHEFMTSLRRTIGDRRDTVLFFELPDVRRVLSDGAFWDIYYEHCSYFSTGSLARLFRETGFEVIEQETVYDDQYLLITARPAEDSVVNADPEQEDLADMRRYADAFSEAVRRTQKKWKDTLQQITCAGERAVLWGAGSKGVAFLTTLGLDDEIAYCVDINPYKHGKFMPGTGHEVAGPDRLSHDAVQHIIVMNPIYTEEIRAEISRLGVHAQLHLV